MTTAEQARFVDERMFFSSVSQDASKLNLAFNGFGEDSVDYASLANDAMKEKNLKKSPNFIFVKPFFDGREAALTPHGAPQGTR